MEETVSLPPMWQRNCTLYDLSQLEGLARIQEQFPLTMENAGHVEADIGASDLNHPAPADCFTKEEMELRREILQMLPVPANRLHPQHQQLVPSILPDLSSPLSSAAQSRRGSFFVSNLDDSWPITQQLFRSCFPFHIIFDKDLVIRHMGTSINRLLPNAIRSSALLTDYFEIERSSIPSLTYQNIRSHVHNEICLRIRDRLIPNIAKMPEFRGQMIPTSSNPKSPILFLASPKIHSFDELKLQGLYLSDVPIHDVTRDLILLNRQLQAEMSMARELEEIRNELVREKENVQVEKGRADELLYAMLPKSVAKQLTKGGSVPAEHYDQVSVLFSDIKGFTTVCSKCQPMQVVDMLSKLYNRFDKKVDEHKVYKVQSQFCDCMHET